MPYIVAIVANFEVFGIASPKALFRTSNKRGHSKLNSFTASPNTWDWESVSGYMPERTLTYY